MKVTLKPDRVEIEEVPAVFTVIAATVVCLLAAAFLKGAGDASDSDFTRKKEIKKELGR